MYIFIFYIIILVYFYIVSVYTSGGLYMIYFCGERVNPSLPVFHFSKFIPLCPSGGRGGGFDGNALCGRSRSTEGIIPHIVERARRKSKSGAHHKDFVMVIPGMPGESWDHNSPPMDGRIELRGSMGKQDIKNPVSMVGYNKWEVVLP